MDQLRQWFTTYDADLARVHRFWEGKGRALVSLHPTDHDYRQCFDDAELLAAAPRFLAAQAALPGLNLPSLYPDWGTVSTARYWGGTPRFDSTGANLFIDPVARTLDAALALTPRPVDDPDLDGAHAVALWRTLSERLDTDALWLRSPDMQGPLNTAGLVLDQEELWIAMLTEPERVHAFLEQVCDLLIHYARYLREATGNRLCGNIWPYTFLPADRGVSLTEDMMPLMSAALYKEFGLPYLRRIGEALGGLQIHCCGAWGHHAATLAEANLSLRAVEYHHPFTTVDQLACLPDNVVRIPYITLDRQDVQNDGPQFGNALAYYRHLLATTPPETRFWFALGNATPASRAFAQEVAVL